MKDIIKETIKDWYHGDGLLQFLLGNIFFDPDQLVVRLAKGYVWFGIAWICVIIAIIGILNVIQ